MAACVQRSCGWFESQSAAQTLHVPQHDVPIEPTAISCRQYQVTRCKPFRVVVQMLAKTERYGNLPLLGAFAIERDQQVVEINIGDMDAECLA